MGRMRGLSKKSCLIGLESGQIEVQTMSSYCQHSSFLGKQHNIITRHDTLRRHIQRLRRQTPHQKIRRHQHTTHFPKRLGQYQCTFTNISLKMHSRQHVMYVIQLRQLICWARCPKMRQDNTPATNALAHIKIRSSISIQPMGILYAYA